MTTSLQYIAEQLGTNKWVVAAKLTAGLKSKGYERAISSDELDALHREWANANPDLARDNLFETRHLNELRLSDDELLSLKRLLLSEAAPAEADQETLATVLRLVEEQIAKRPAPRNRGLPLAA